ncbi:MAG: hypothetical protein LQ352_002600 [Teloschistes flavicans]|nr:MAG: hypothetical protein LQ352_002600 [Teloschistes flavicans]
MSSTLRFSPPTSDPQSADHLNGFNNHADFDTFFAAPLDDEQLLEFSSHTSPSSNIYSNVSSPPTTKQPSPKPAAYDYPQHQDHPYNSVDPAQSLDHSTQSSANGHAVDTTYNYAASNATTHSPEYSYQHSNHSATPNLHHHLVLEHEFDGFLSSLGDNVELNWTEPSSTQSPEAGPYNIHTSSDSNHTNPPSAGTATQLSRLMSPSLTDNPSPGSRDGRSSPAMDRHPVSSGVMGNIVTSYAKSDEHSQHSGHGHGEMLQTPTLTGSSIDTSPERPIAARPHSPVFKIESWSRGDSPNRLPDQFGRSVSKRSRSSLHLAVERDESSSEEEMEEEGRHDSGTTIKQDTTRIGRSLTPGRAGLDPQARLRVGDAEVPNFKDQAEGENIALKIADVEDWLARSETGSEAGGNLSPPPRPRAMGRRRAKSTGDRTLTHENLMELGNAPPSTADMHVPGPGLIIDEESDADWDMDDDEEEADPDAEEGLPESPPAIIGIEDPTGNVPEAAAQDQFASPPPLYRARVWQDPLYDSSNPGPGVKMQPVTANEAMMRFQQRAKDTDALSRAATWGTRRLSESDLEGLFQRFSFKNTEEDKDKGDRRGSFLEAAAAKLLPKRRQSILRRHESDANKQHSHRPSVSDHKKADSFGSLKERETLAVPPQRKATLGKRPKSPRLDTGSALAAMTGQIAAIGAGKGGPPTATGSETPTGPWKNVIKRNRSRSDLQPHRASGSLADLWQKQGGPPMPTLAAPPQSPPREEEKIIAADDMVDLDDDDDEQVGEDKGITIDLSIRQEPLVPTMEGFRSNVRKLNPRLPHFLVERIAQEQLRRYKKLIDFKVKHVQALATGKCPSNNHCFEMGGEATFLPSKGISKEATELSQTGFAVAGLGQSDDDANALAEGVVTPAQFPPGVPMPPVKRLPAEFECSLCFKVKKFHKPSDWSKHVHEDVQPFTCTFQSCAEPKSFKRKADWVRHENERHRQLEWWMCNMPDCSHKCYRKDNFVQHLVREHKLPEPKVKTGKAGKPAVRGPSNQKARAKGEFDDLADELDQVWRLVDECRHETIKNPKDEACKFCGNICNSWKKLTVHLAKHMEQISMPVLNVAKAKEVTPETIISPIEQRTSQNTSNSPIGQSPYGQNPSIQSSLHSSISPFGSMGHSSVTPMGDLGGYSTPMPTNFYDNESMSQFQRSQASTYPPQIPQQQVQSNYPAGRGAPYNVSSFNSYPSGANASSQFVSINQQQHQPTHSTYPYPTQSASPENLYASSSMRPPPTSQRRTSSFMSQQQSRPYSSTPTTYPSQGQFPTQHASVNATDNGFGYPTSQSPPMQAYSQSTQSLGVGAPIDLEVIPVNQFTAT